MPLPLRRGAGPFRAVTLSCEIIAQRGRFRRFRKQREHLPAIDVDGSSGGWATGPTIGLQVPMVGRMSVSGSLMPCRLACPNGLVSFGGKKMSASAGALRVGIANLGRLRDDHRQTATSASHNAPAGCGVGRQCMPARTEEPKLHIGSVARRQRGVKRSNRIGAFVAAGEPGMETSRRTARRREAAIAATARPITLLRSTSPEAASAAQLCRNGAAPVFSRRRARGKRTVRIPIKQLARGFA